MVQADAALVGSQLALGPLAFTGQIFAVPNPPHKSQKLCNMDDGQDNSIAVQLCQVHKAFGSRTVLAGVDLEVRRGEVFALLGSSGSGKSTILKIASGIETPDRGQVRLNGKDVTTFPPHRRHVHTVFQSYALFPHLDVAGNVAFPLKVAHAPAAEVKRRVGQALAWVRLDEFATRRVHTLSGGERQRVALARALVDEPQCVLLDEPLSALDPHLRASTLELLQEIQRRLGVTYIYVTHDREEALRAAHRMAVLNAGTIEQVGTPEEVYRSPQTEFVASFVGRINWFDGRWEHRDGPCVRLASGQIIPLEGRKLSVGYDKVRVGVRPEDLILGSSGFLRARVITKHFSGTSLAFTLELEDRASIAAEVRDINRSLNVGDNVHVSWSPRSAHFFQSNGKRAEA